MTSILQNLLNSDKYTDLGRMYDLVARIPEGLTELKNVQENHILEQGRSALEKCGDAAINVSSLNMWKITPSRRYVLAIGSTLSCVGNIAKK